MLFKGQLLTYNENTRREKEEILETIMAEDFLKLMPDTKPQIEEAQRTPNKIKKQVKNRTTVLRHRIFKLQKNQR